MVLYRRVWVGRLLLPRGVVGEEVGVGGRRRRNQTSGLAEGSVNAAGPGIESRRVRCNYESS